MVHTSLTFTGLWGAKWISKLSKRLKLAQSHLNCLRTNKGSFFSRFFAHFFFFWPLNLQARSGGREGSFFISQHLCGSIEIIWTATLLVLSFSSFFDHKMLLQHPTSALLDAVKANNIAQVADLLHDPTLDVNQPDPSIYDDK